MNSAKCKEKREKSKERKEGREEKREKRRDWLGSSIVSNAIDAGGTTVQDRLE